MLYIGIDPGVNTGFAVWDTTRRQFLRVETLRITEALLAVLSLQEGGGELWLIFEDARQRKWLPRETSNSEYRGKLMGAGSVKRDCDIWEEFCTAHHIAFSALPPRKGLTKWTPESFARQTGWTGRTSNHARDAAMLVFQRK